MRRGKKITQREKKEIEAKYARPHLVNGQEEWFCHYCETSFGLQPRGIRIVCPNCKQECLIPGADVIPRKRKREFSEIEKRSKEYASEKYKLMRER